MNTGKLADMARDLYRWWPLLDEQAAHAGEPHAPTGGGGGDGSPVEAALETRETIRALQARLASLAAEAHAAHSGEETPTPDIHPALIILALAAWIERQAFAVPFTAELATVWTRAGRLAGYTPDRAEQACPSCRARGDMDAPRLERTPTREGLPDLYTCPRCGYAAVIEKAGPWNAGEPTNTVRVTWRVRVQEALEASTDWVRPAEAARLAGIPAATVRTWKHRGEIETDLDGNVQVGEVARRAHNN